MNRALPGDLLQKAAHQSLHYPHACQRVLCNAGCDTGLYMSLYTDFKLMVKQVKTHLSVTYYTRQIAQYFCRVPAYRMSSTGIFIAKKVIPALKYFQAQKLWQKFGEKRNYYTHFPLIELRTKYTK